MTSTEVAALFGLSPYMTEFELWHRHRDASVVQIDQNERMLWGTRLQDAIAGGIAQDMGWKIRRMPEYIRDPALRMGASFDFEIEPKDENHPFGLLEVKNVDSLMYRQGWIVDGDDIQAPPHIELQLQHQMAVSGRPFAYIGALIGGNRTALVRREADAVIIRKIKTRVVHHWQSVAAGIEPAPDFTRDSEFIARLYGLSEKDKLFDATANDEIKQLVNEYRARSEEMRVCESKRSEIKARILATVGDCEKVLGEGFTISTGMTAPSRVEAFERKGFRNFRVNVSKGKE